MVLGDVRHWTSLFITTDDRILERIAVLWPTCVSLLSAQPKEDDITMYLIDLLWKDPVVRRICHWVEYQFEPFGIACDGRRFSKGKIDMAILLDWDRERYLAYECKRLNVTYHGRRQSLAKAYVEDGMMRFMTEQYAEELPIGCILGYVMDGDIAFAKRQLVKAIDSHESLNLLLGPTAKPATAAVTGFLTSHKRPTIPIELRHSLLVF